MGNSKQKALVTVSIPNAKKISPAMRKQINNWLRRVGTALIREGGTYSTDFRSSFFPPSKR